MRKKIHNILKESARIHLELAYDRVIAKDIAKISEKMIAAIKGGGKIIVFGNGGSAADSQHLACELVGRFKKQRKAFPAVALTTNTSTLTAVANDYSFEDTFSRQLEALVKRGDVAVGISTSGDSPNVLKAVKLANRLGATSVGITGKTGGALKPLCKYAICAPSSDVPRVQELHITVIHAITEMVEEGLCGLR